MTHLSSTWGDTGNKPNSSLGVMAIILGLNQEVTFSALQKVILSLTLRRGTSCLLLLQGRDYRAIIHQLVVSLSRSQRAAACVLLTLLKHCAVDSASC